MKKFLLAFGFLFSTTFAGGADFGVHNLNTGDSNRMRTFVGEKFFLAVEKVKNFLPKLRGMRDNISCDFAEENGNENIFECVADEPGEAEIFFEVLDDKKIKSSNLMQILISDEKLPLKIDYIFFDKNRKKMIAPVFNYSENKIETAAEISCGNIIFEIENTKVRSNEWEEILAEIQNFDEIENLLLHDEIFSCYISAGENISAKKEFDFRFSKINKNFETLNFRDENEPRNFPIEEMKKEKISCVDDDGKNFFEKNFTKIFDQNGFLIRENEDKCLGPKLQEFFCDENNLENYEEIFCENGCENGACKKEFVPPADYEKDVRSKNLRESPFFDIDENHEFGRAAISCYWNEIAGGYKIKNYDKPAFFPNKLLNRAEAVKFILLATKTEINLEKKFKKNYPENLWFQDLFDGEWYVPFVMKAAEKGIIDGYFENGFRVFGPDEILNAAEFAKILVEGFNFPINEKFHENSREWFDIYFWTLEEKNIDFVQIDPDSQINRGQAVQAIFQLLEQQN